MGKISKALEKRGTNLDEVSPHQDLKAETEQPTFQFTSDVKADFVEEAPQQEDNEEYINDLEERLRYAIDKHSGVPESIAKLRTKILYPDSDEHISSIMISSCSAQEGKSFVCANLGISIAHSMERHALMVDCDLRRPSLQNLLGLKHKKGLTNYLQNKDNLSELIQPTRLSKLSILPSGPPPRNPAELVSSHKMSTLLDEVKLRYNDRLILLDSPPFLAASETLVLAQQVDKVILVVRWGKSARESIKKMVEAIGKSKIIGIVFNAYEMNIIDRKVQGLSYQDYQSETYY